MRNLLKVFWENHDPTQGMRRQCNDVGTQYRSAIYATSDEQLATALASRDAFAPAVRAARRRDHHGNREGQLFFFAEDYPPAVPFKS